MIVADTNLIVYFLIRSEFTREAEAVYKKDPRWAAPRFWQSEFRNVLAGHLRRGHLELEQCLALMGQAERLMKGREFDVQSTSVLRLAAESGCSAYDCEFAALALELGIPLITSDVALLANFKSVAVSMRSFAS
ncbi:MAG TPA: type II toxin-antitoxin system VapC family toxin [Terriglobia bacterium]|nr:type II toxin-antitoxin system VapC family toxin [Terriglobia bacterium]